jgi:hypothetical protein
LAQKETKDIRCPFCGAPYKKLVPPNALQLKCDYCGATFHTPPKLGVEIPQCRNHHERFATGICNDCGESFCSECLKAFPLFTEHARAMLYLCPNCLRKRNLDKVDATVLTGTLFLIAGVLLLGASLAFGSFYWPLAVFMVFVGVVWVWYAVGKRNEIPPEIISETMPETGIAEEEETGAGSDEVEAEEAGRLYDQLFTKYVEHWGIQTGAQLLESEIKAYTWHGDTYAQAIKKVADRQKKKTR